MPGEGEQGTIVCPMDPRQGEAEWEKSKRKMRKQASHMGAGGDEVGQAQDGHFSSQRSCSRRTGEAAEGLC